MFDTVSENQEFFPYGYELQAMNDQGIYSPLRGSQGAPSVASPMSTALSPLSISEFISFNDATFIGEPHLKILVQPMEKFRFRYKSEMVGTHGSLMGSSNSNSRNKNAPTVQLHNYLESAIIRCTLVTSDDGLRIPHAHKLVHRDGGLDYDDPYHVTVSAETGYVAAFPGMAIIHTARKNIKDELIKKLRSQILEEHRRTNPKATLSIRDEAEIKADAETKQKCVNLNTVALCFQAFISDEHGVMIPITKPVYSQTINNLKSALTGELKICRIDKHTSSVEGQEEIFILVEKVGKKNIKVKFFELNENDCEIWSSYGTFSELDVHHQYAIVFRTPPYRDFAITSPKKVFLQLERPSDGDLSEPIPFTYKPSDRIMGRKRQRMSNSGSTELSHILTPNVSKESILQTLNVSNTQEMSTEIKKILSEGNTSSITKDLLAGIDVDTYLKLLDNGEENMLTTDSASTVKQQDDADFAKSILFEIVQCMKMDLKDIKEHIQKLLKDRTTYGDTPLHAALRYGQRCIVKYLLMLISTDKDSKTLVNIQNSSGKTPLHYAVLQNQPEITKVLLMLGADPNQTDEHGYSPLHIAAKIPEASSCIDVLLAKGEVDIEVHNDIGWTALHLAAESGAYETVCSLIRAGANVNNTDMSYGRTALHIAVEGGHKNIVEYLLKKTNILVNKTNFSGNTALHTAVVHTGARAKEMCTLLIEHGADPHIQNHNRELDDVDERKETSVNIKIEIDSEEETVEMTGQSSFDLAMNKPDILELLNGQTVKTTNNICSVATKLELKEEDTQINWLNNEHKEKLSVLLDKTQGWRKLAKHLNFESLLKMLEHSSIPSLLLLNYIDVGASLSSSNLQDVLRKIGETEAADYINEVSSMYS